MDGSAPRWTMLNFGASRLALPSTAVLGVLPLEQLDPGAGAPGAVGQLFANGQECPVYALDEHFLPEERVAPGRRACVLIGSGGAAFGLVCDEVHLLQPRTARVHELPAAMRRGGSPVRQLLFAGDTMVPIVTVESLMDLLGAVLHVPARIES